MFWFLSFGEPFIIGQSIAIPSFDAGSVNLAVVCLFFLFALFFVFYPTSTYLGLVFNLEIL